MPAGERTLTSGNDNFTATNYYNWIHAGAGDDTLFYDPVTNNAPSTSWYDYLNPGHYLWPETVTNVLDGEAGNDTIVNWSGAGFVCWIEGGAGNDKIFLGAGRDGVDGGDNDDTVFALFADQLTRGDALDGGTGTDKLVIYNGAGGGYLDLVYGGTNSGATLANFEVLEYYGSASSDQVAGGALADSIGGAGGKDLLTGRGGADALYGGADDDTLSGEADADRLYGEDGRDLVLGGEGADMLSGGLDIDTLIGGVGSDIFTFSRNDSRAFTNGVFTADLVRDFQDAGLEQDIINLAAIDGNENVAGKQLLFFDDGDGVSEIGEVLRSTTLNASGQQISILYTDVNGGGADFALQFDRVISTFDASDFAFGIAARVVPGGTGGVFTYSMEGL
jgi:Ca2+-binding RTX toxin-like protein